MQKISFRLALFLLVFFVSNLSAQFDWSYYKYVLIEHDTKFVVKTSGKPDELVSLNIEQPIHEAFEDFNPEKQKKKTPACSEITVDQFKFLNKFEVAVAFVHVSYDAFGKVVLDVFDSATGWSKPAASFSFSPTYPGRFELMAESASNACKLWIQSAVPANFDEANSNAYFSNTERTAYDFFGDHPSRGGVLTKEKKVFENILFESKEEIGDINSVFIIGLPSQGCDGVKTQGEGLVQIASLKLMPHFKILERSNLDAVLEEQKLSVSGLTDESTLLSLGKLEGSEGIIFCQESCISGKSIQTVKLLDCNTGEQQWIASGFGEDPLILMDAVIQELD